MREGIKARNLRAEAENSLENGEETALAVEWSVKWDIGAPEPHVISSSHKTFLLYFPSTSDTKIALVEFTDCYAYKFGGINDEVIDQHPLWGKGLELYNAHIIANSHWLRHEQLMNSTHLRYNPERWEKRKHFLLLFHDELFECIAEGYAIELIEQNMETVASIALSRLFK